METKSNHILVGIVTLALLILGALFFLWLSRYDEGSQKEYDIFFQQSVNGLAKGSSVAFSGVPVGQISEIKLWEPDPDFVRVRIQIDEKVPVLQGTTATISGVGFTGVSEIQLDGAVKGAAPISCPDKNRRSICPADRPVIPTKPGALGELLNSAPLLLERLSTLTERLTNILSDKNQGSIERILGNVENLSGTMARQAPSLQGAVGDSRLAIAESRRTLQQAAAAMNEISATANNASALMNEQGKPAIADLRATLAAANRGLSQLESTLKSTNPAVQTLTTQTLPEFSQLARDVQKLSRSIESLSSRLDEDGSSFLLGARPLPDYDPKKSK